MIWYEDVVLYEPDMESLRPYCFLSDKVIEFYFAYLTSSYKSDAVQLVDPTFSSLLAHCGQAGVSSFADKLFSTKSLVLFAVNDSGIGSHWSILVYHRAINSFIHYDTCDEMNHVAAMDLYEAVKDHMGPGAPAGSPVFMEGKDTPQQSTPFDCGLYVLAIAEAICQWYVREMYTKLDLLSAVAMQVDLSVEFHMRDKVHGIIRKLGTSQ